MQGFWRIRSQIHLQTVNFQAPFYDYPVEINIYEVAYPFTDRLRHAVLIVIIIITISTPKHQQSSSSPLMLRVSLFYFSRRPCTLFMISH